MVLIILAFIVCFTFIGVSVASKLSKGSQAASGAEGSIFGKEITTQDFRTAQFFELGMRSDAKLTPDENKILRKRVWERIALLESAQRIGISVSEQELMSVLKNEQAFLVNGVFSKEKFRSILAKIDISEQIYENYLREELTIQKMMNIMMSSTWIPPSEAQQRASSLLDSFTVEYFVINNSDKEDKDKVSEELAAKYYDQNKHLFETSEMVSVKYIDFPVSNYLANINVDDTEIERLYYDNIDDYSNVDTNNNSVPLPLTEVSESIKNIIIQRKALSLTADKATDVVMTMAPTRSGAGLSIERAAAKFDMQVNTSTLFTATANIPDINAGLEFNRIAFSLDPTDLERSFSDAIEGSNNVYVIAANERVAPRIPDFSEVRDKVMPMAQAESRKKSLEKKSSDIRNSVIEKMASGASFTKAASALHMNTVSTTETFTVYSGIMSNAFEYSSDIIPNVMGLTKGDVAEPIDIGDGIMIASVTERAPGEAFSIQTIKPQIIATMERYRTSLVFEDWRAANLANAKFQDNREVESTSSDSSNDSNEIDLQ